MTSIVIGGGLGVVGSSATQVNGYGISGQGKVGQGNDLAVVNATNGNLILQGQDEFIAGIGIDDALLRTYNSQGTLDGDNNDGWRLSLFRSLRNNGNNTFTRIAADGHQELLSSVGTGVWRSLEGEGGGAHDVLRTVSTPRVTGEAYEYEAGGSGVFEMYDSTGKLLGWRDDSGNVTTLTYTGSLVTSVSDSSGQTVTLTYGAGAASSDLLSMQITARAIGAPGTPATFYTQTRVTYTYDSQHRLSQVKVDLTPYKSSDATNANQADNSFYYTTYQYDGTSTRVTKITQSTDQAGTAVNSSLTIAYVVQGNVYRVSTLTDAQGRATQFHYDLNKGRTDVTDALGNVTSYFYDNQGRLVGVESPDIGGGKRTLTSYQYDANNNIIAVTDAEGRSVHYAYDADGNVKEIRDQTGNTIRRLYDADDRLLAETVFQTSAAANYGAAEPANPLTTHYVYDSSERLSFVITPEGRVTQYVYNALGQRASTLKYTSTLYTVASQYTASPAYPTITGFSLTQLQNWVAGTADKSQIERSDISYDPTGQVESVTTYQAVDSSGNGVAAGSSVIHYVYDSEGRLLMQVDPRSPISGNLFGAAYKNGTTFVTSYAYDGLDRQIFAQDASGRTTTTSYDDVNNRITVVLSSGLTTVSTYNKSGDIISKAVSGQASGVLGTTQYFYDNDGRLITSKDSTGATTHYIWDAVGRQVGIIDPENELTEIIYNDAGQKLREVHYANKVTATLTDTIPVDLYAVRGGTRPEVAPGVDLDTATVGNGYRAAYSASGSSISIVSSTLTVSDADNATLASAQITLNGILNPGLEILSVDAATASSNGITQAYNSSTGILTLTGNVSAASYQAVLRTLKYANTGSPLKGGDRTIDVTVNDSQLNSNIATAIVTIAGAPPPVIDLNGYGPGTTRSVTYPIVLGSPLPLAPNVILYDLGSSTVTSATVVIQQSLLTDTLAVKIPSGYGVTSSYNVFNGTLSITGTATRDVYTQILRSLTLQAGVQLLDRAISISFSNGTTTATSIVTVTPSTVTDANYPAASGVVSVSGGGAVVIPSIASDADRTSNWLYDRAGRLIYTIDAAGYATQYSYDGAGRKIAQTEYANPLLAGNSVPTSGQSEGFTVPADAGGKDRTTRYFYDGDGRAVATLDAAGYLIENIYDAAGQLIKTIGYANPTPAAQRASGALSALRPTADSNNDHVSYFFYNAEGQLTTQIDPNGYVSSFQYTLAGQQSGKTQYYNAVSYNGTQTLSQIIAAATVPVGTRANDDDQTWSWSYDALGRVIQQTDNQGTVTQYVYDAVTGFLTSQTTAQGTSDARTTTYQYDDLGRVTNAISGKGSNELASNPAVWNTDGTGYGHKSIYDLAGRKIEAIDPNGHKTFYYYNQDSQLVYTVDGAGAVTQSVYDAFGEVKQVIQYSQTISNSALKGGLLSDSANAAFVTTVTASSFRSDIRNRSSSYTYDDKRGLLTKTTDALGYSTANSYDAFGDLITQVADISANGIPGTTTRTDQYQYDARGLKTQGIQDVGGLNITAKVLQYDAFGRAKQTQDANGNITNVTYNDHIGRVVTVTDPLSKATVTTYDAFGRTIRLTDRNGNATNYSYTDSTQKMTITTPEGVVTSIVSNRFGQKISITTGSAADGTLSVTTYDYDKDGNLKTTIVDSGSNHLNLTTVNSYDNADLLIKTVDANLTPTTYEYDAANRVLKRIVDPTSLNPISGLNLTTRYAYNAFGQAYQVIDANNITTETVFDNKGESTAVIMDAVDQGGQPGSALKIATLYTYDARGNTLKVQEGMQASGSTGSWTFAATANTTPKITQYVYDKAGRRTSQIVDPGALNITTSYAYDSNGNMVHKTDANNNAWTYVYDANNRQVYVIDPLGDVTETRYDAEGQIVKTIQYSEPIDISQLTTVPSEQDIQMALALGTIYSNDFEGVQNPPIGLIYSNDFSNGLNGLVISNGSGGQIAIRNGQLSVPTTKTTDIPTSHPMVRGPQYDLTAGSLTTVFNSEVNTGSYINNGTGSNWRSLFIGVSDANGDYATGNGNYFGIALVNGNAEVYFHTTAGGYGWSTYSVPISDNTVYVVNVSADSTGQCVTFTEKATGTVLLSQRIVSIWSSAGFYLANDINAQNYQYAATTTIDNLTVTAGTIKGLSISNDSQAQIQLQSGHLSISSKATSDTTTYQPTIKGAQYALTDGTLPISFHNEINTGPGSSGRYLFDGIGDANGHYVGISIVGNQAKISYYTASTGYVTGTAATILDNTAYIIDVLVTSEGFRVTFIQKTAGTVTLSYDLATTDWMSAGFLINTIAEPGHVTATITLDNLLVTSGAIYSNDFSNGLNGLVVANDSQGQIVTQNGQLTLSSKSSTNGSTSYPSVAGAQNTLAVDGRPILFRSEINTGVSSNGRSAFSGVRDATGNFFGIALLGNQATVFFYTATTGYVQGPGITVDDSQNYVVEISATASGIGILFFNKSTGKTSTTGLSYQIDTNWTSVGFYAYTVAQPAQVSQTIAIDNLNIYRSTTADASDRISRNVYNKDGKIVYTLDALGDVTGYGYDKAGRITDTIQYAQALDLTQIPDIPNLADISGKVDNLDPLNQHASVLYDNAGRSIASIDASGAIETYAYDAVGNKVSFTNKLGNTWHYVYDAGGRQVLEVNPAVSTYALALGTFATSANSNNWLVSRRYTYDKLGNVTFISDGYAILTPDGKTYSFTSLRDTQYKYDHLGRQVSTVTASSDVYNLQKDFANGYSSASASSFTTTGSLSNNVYFDRLGNAIVGRDAALTNAQTSAGDSIGRFSYKIYDQAGRVSYEVDALRQVTHYTYDALGNQVTLTRYANPLLDQDGSLAALENILRADVVGSASAMSDALSAQAKVASLINGGSLTSGDSRTIVTDYDALGRKSKVQLPAVDYYITTDSSGVVSGASSATKQSPITKYGYDAFGNQVSQQQLNDPVSGTWLTTYQGYDLLGRVTGIIDPSGYYTQNDYDAFGRLSKTSEYAKPLSNVVYLSNGLPDFQHAISFSLIKTPASPAISASATDVSGYDRVTKYGYDLLNHRISQTRVGVRNYFLDTNGSLQGGVADVSTYETYDAVGNVTSSTDEQGNTTVTYYDALGQVVQVRAPSRTTPTVSTAPAISFRSISASYSLSANLLNINWDSIDTLGSGDIKVIVTYEYDYVTQAGGGTVVLHHAPVTTTVLLPNSASSNVGAAIALLSVGRNFVINSYQIQKSVGGSYITIFNSSQSTNTIQFEIGGLPANVANLTFQYGVSGGSLSTIPATKIGTSWVVQLNGLNTGSSYQMSLVAKDSAGNNVSLIAYGGTSSGTYTTIFTAQQTASGTLRVNPKSVEQTFAPTTAFKYDLFGNQVEQLDYDGTTVSIAGVLSAGYRSILSYYDLLGHVVMSRDPAADKYTAYDALGNVARTWSSQVEKGIGTYSYESLTKADVYLYDAIGHQVETRHLVMSPTSPGIAVQSEYATFNAFGEITGKSVSGIGGSEKNDYDAAGRLWQSNKSGVDTVYRYDLLGRMTEQVQVGGVGSLPSGALSPPASLAIPSDILSIQNGQATDYVYDALGRVVAEKDPDVTQSNVPYPISVLTSPTSGRLRINLGGIYAESATDRIYLYYRVYGTTGSYSSIQCVYGSGYYEGILPTLSAGSYQFYFDTQEVASNFPTIGSDHYAGNFTVTASQTIISIQIDPLSPTKIVQRQQFDRWGNVLSATDALGATTQYTYNDENSLELTIQPNVTVWNQTNGTSTTARPNIYSFYDSLGRVVATKDANGYLTREFYDAAGNRVQEVRPDGGILRWQYDQLGRQVAAMDGAGHVTARTYDAADRLISEKVLGQGSSSTYSYDSSGNRIQTVDAMGETTIDHYDTRGNIVEHDTPLGVAIVKYGTTSAALNDRSHSIFYSYDAMGNLISQRNGLQPGATTGASGYNSESWIYDYYGHLLSHTDLSGSVHTYFYDGYGRLVKETSTVVNQSVIDPSLSTPSVPVYKSIATGGVNKTYTYYSNGWLASVRDQSSAVGASYDWSTYYAYDADGRQIYTNSTEGGSIQSTRTYYDAIGRVQGLRNTLYGMTYGYDAVGNRIRIYTQYVTAPGQTTHTNLDFWNKYDQENRLTLDSGQLSGGTVVAGSTGTSLLYDLGGNRRSATQNSTVITYDYTTNNLLDSTYKNGYRIAENFYDNANRVVAHYAYKGDGITLYPTSWGFNFYNSNGWLLEDVEHDPSGTADTFINFGAVGEYNNAVNLGFTIGGPPPMAYALPDADSNPNVLSASIDAGNYDAIGNLLGYVVTVASDNAPYINTYKNSYLALGDGYQAWSEYVTTTLSQYNPGSVLNTFDTHGNIIKTVNAHDTVQERDYVLNPNGQIIRQKQTRSGSSNYTQYYFYDDGKPVGDTGNINSTPNFDYNYTPVSDQYPSSTPGTYVIQKNDTLQSIASTVFGDASLWYLIADANGITGTTLTIGRVLTIPNQVTNIHNNSDTYRPYNLTQVVGNISPTLLPPPPPREACKALSIIFAVVVAAIVTYYGGPVAGAAAFSDARQTSSAILNNQFDWSRVGHNLLDPFGGNRQDILATFTGPMHAGIKGGFDYKGQAIAAAAAFVGSYVGEVVGPAVGGGVTGAVVGGATGAAAADATSQGLNIALNRQHGFSWREFSASAAGGAVGAVVSIGTKQLLSVENPSRYTSLAINTTSGFFAGVANAAVYKAVNKNGTIDWARIAVDSFGNALGNSIVDATQNTAEEQAKAQQRAKDVSAWQAHLMDESTDYDPNGPSINAADQYQFDLLNRSSDIGDHNSVLTSDEIAYEQASYPDTSAPSTDATTTNSDVGHLNARQSAPRLGFDLANVTDPLSAIANPLGFPAGSDASQAPLDRQNRLALQHIAQMNAAGQTGLQIDILDAAFRSQYPLNRSAYGTQPTLGALIAEYTDLKLEGSYKFEASPKFIGLKFDASASAQISYIGVDSTYDTPIGPVGTKLDINSGADIALAGQLGVSRNESGIPVGVGKLSADVNATLLNIDGSVNAGVGTLAAGFGMLSVSAGAQYGQASAVDLGKFSYDRPKFGLVVPYLKVTQPIAKTGTE